MFGISKNNRTNGPQFLHMGTFPGLFDVAHISKYNEKCNLFQELNIIHSVHFLFYVYCPTNVHFYSLLIVKRRPICFEPYPGSSSGTSGSMIFWFIRFNIG